MTLPLDPKERYSRLAASFSEVASRLPEVSRTTAYSLEALMDLELLKRVEHPVSSVRYEANLEPHHHCLCTRCGALSNLLPGAVAGSENLAFVASQPAMVERVSVLVRGTCGACVPIRP